MSIIWPGTYFDGLTCGVTNSSVSVVVGGDLSSSLANLDPGAAGMGFLGPDDRLYAISAMSYNSGTGQTTLTLGWAYKGSTASTQPFSVVPIQGFAASASARLSSLMSKVDPGSVALYVSSTATLLAAYASGVTVPNVVVTLGRAAAADGGGATFYYDASDSTTADDGGIVRVDGASRRWKILFSGSIDVRWYGVKADGATNNSTALAAALLAVASGGTLQLPSGTIKHATTLTVPPKVNLLGMGMGVTILSYTGTTLRQINMPLVGVTENVVEYGGNHFKDITFQGAGASNTISCFKVKNKTNVTWTHCEFLDFKYHIEGTRDDVGNACTNFSWVNCRFGTCKTAIYAARQWNGMNVDAGCDFFSFDNWAIIGYDCDKWEIAGTFDGNPATSGAGHVFFGGSNAINISAYFEGTPAVNHFIQFRISKDELGNSSVGGIAISASAFGGKIAGARWSSGGGTAYGIKFDGARGVMVTGCFAGSGISSAIAYFTTNTRGNSIIDNYSAPGTHAVFQTAADSGYSRVSNYPDGIVEQQFNCNVATAGDPTAPGQWRYVANETGGKTMAFSTATGWHRCQDLAPISV